MSRPTRYWWFGPETVQQLTARLNAAGAEARLEVRIDKQRSMTLQVVVGGSDVAATEAPFNKSFLCPPICP